MSRKNKINTSTNVEDLNTFIGSVEFSDVVLRDIFYELVTKYKGETPRQHLIRAVVLLYEKRYPAEMRTLEKVLKRRKELSVNEFSADKKQDIRLSMSFPQSLWSRLQMAVKDPVFLHQSNPITKEEKEEFDWILKNFPEFKVPEKI